MNEVPPPIPDPSAFQSFAASAATQPKVTSRPEFTGSGSEFFRIWIVNMFLTLVTLGFFIPWAKVRTRRYFYRETRIGDENFDYLADPKKLLIGYLIVGTFLLLYSLGEYISVWVVPAVVVLVMIAYPWIRWKSARFFAANSSYRHLTFSFNGSLGESYKVFLGYPILGAITLGVLYPLAAFRGRRYYFENFSYGNSRSEFHGRVGYFYKVYLIAFGIFAAFIILFSAFMGFGMAQAFNSSSVDCSEEDIEWIIEDAEGMEEPQSEGEGEDLSDFEWSIDDQDEWDFDDEFNIVTLFVIVVIAFFYLVFFGGLAVMRILILNHCWSSLRFSTPGGPITFTSRIHPVRYLWIVASNLVLCLVTIGIYIPFAKVRLHRYRLACLEIDDVFLAESCEGTGRADVGALGETASDWLDFDFGL